MTRGRWLAVAAVAYCLCHHIGSLPRGLGSAGRGTRVADWLDLLTPFLVLPPALLALRSARVSPVVWGWFVVGALLYTTGHGLHLSANSIGNVDPGPTAHLWDEDVGHWLWFSGVAVVAGTLATGMRTEPRPRWPGPWLLAVLVGLTWASNAIGGHFWLAGLVGAAAAAFWGLRHRRQEAVLLVVAAVPAAVLVVGWLAAGSG